MGVKATVLGASGYSGGEVLRYLATHPAIEVVCASAGSKAGAQAGDVLPHLVEHRDLDLVPLAEAIATPADVVFSCLPAGELPEAPGDVCVVDLSDHYRADPAWTYGLCELSRTGIPGSSAIANPGCYPTATLLCLVPFARVGLIEGTVVVDAMSGTSGAGRKGQDHLIHATLHGDVTAYGDVAHRHVPEMERGLLRYGGLDTTVSFTPHLVPMTRGLLVTARGRLTTTVTDGDVTEILNEAYAEEPFVSVIEGWPSPKSVAGTNRAVVAARVDPRTGMLVCSAAIDNLGKGAAGQAIQNVNLALGLGEETGLDAVGVWP
jgi:N-acetyl-gamma-glutamyl-phosphate reductase